MRAFAQYGYKGQELRDLNRCHMFLQAIWISDICDGMGWEILLNAWDGQYPLDSPFHWPPTIVTHPDWQLWQQAL